jgi:tetratricopeptide (TPR) repeat protein
MEAKLSDDGTLQGNAELSTRGDLEYILRSAFRSVSMSRWKELAQQISLNLGFGGEVSDVTASAPEKTDEPFHFAYKYVRKEYGDWPNRRILAPAPNISLPLLSDEVAASSVPLWLGPPIEITFHTQLELPKGYSPEVPAPIHLKRNFAEYDATYNFKDGRLISDRHLRTFTSELPKIASEEYTKFCKKIQDDYQSFIALSSGTSPPSTEPSAAMSSLVNFMNSLPDSANPEAARLERDAVEAMRRNDLQSAVSSLYRAVSADPKFTRAWITLGGYLMGTHQFEAGMDAFRKVIATNPKEPVTQKLFALSLMAASKTEEAISAWQDYTKLDPEDADGFFNLGSMFLQSQHYDEATQAFESAVKLNPQRANYQWQLGAAYLRAEMDEKATEAFRRLLELNPGPEMLNQTAYEMEKRHELLPTALEYAEKAVRMEEEASTRIEGANLKPADEWHTQSLAAYWSTLGWLQARASKLEEAEKTLKAAWKLTQNGVAAARLCELYDREHKIQAASQMCRFAAYRLPLEQAPALYHISELLIETNKRLEHMSPGRSSASDAGSTSEEIFRLRNFKLPHLVPGTESGEFLILIRKPPISRSRK